MSVSRLMKQATVLLRDALRVRPGDEVLIVWDETVAGELVDACRYAATALGVRPYVLSYQPVAYRPMAEFGLFAGASLRPEGLVLPAGLGQALQSCQTLVFATSDLEIMYAPALRQALGNGARAISLSYLTVESATRLLPESPEEVEEVRRLTEIGGELIGAATRARVTSPGGTDVTMSLGQYAPRLHTGVPGPGTRQTLPGGQVTRIPDDRTANGVIVIDRSIAADDFKQITEAVRLTVENGYVTKVDGGLEALKLRRWLEQKGDPEIYHLTELAYGTNRRCRLTGVAAPAEDTHTIGTVSFALGADVHIGGKTQAPAHVDMTMRFATLELDGRQVIDDGVLLTQ